MSQQALLREGFFIKEIDMWKLAIGFVIFAAIALWMLSKGGNIDIGGEKLGDDATHPPAVVVPAAGPAKAASAP